MPTVPEIAEVLVRQWDPVGVLESDDQPEAEYTYEARQLQQLLNDGANEATIIEYLGTRNLGHVSPERIRATAAALTALR